MSKLLVALLFGGRSREHEVSRNSAYTVAQSLKDNYEVYPIGIAKDGQWYGPIPIEKIPSFTPEDFPENKVTILPNPISNGTIYALPTLQPLVKAQVFFPILHGTFGEDGTIQGLLELANVPYVGSGVLASSVGLDKIIMKNLFAQAGLPQVPYLSILRRELETDISGVMGKIEKEIGYPCFIKPANTGSSVGISKANNQEQLKAALLLAARYDRKMIVEKGIIARELEVSVLGNDEPIASLPGEVIPGNEFYDYEDKYINNTTTFHIPARLEEEKIKEIQELAIKAYKALDCAGFSRIDFFMTKDTNEIMINEINTLPGFTAISMYPKLWEHSGISIKELTSKLVELALENFADKNKNITFYETET